MNESILGKQSNENGDAINFLERGYGHHPEVTKIIDEIIDRIGDQLRSYDQNSTIRRDATDIEKKIEEGLVRLSSIGDLDTLEYDQLFDFLYSKAAGPANDNEASATDEADKKGSYRSVA